MSTWRPLLLSGYRSASFIKRANHLSVVDLITFSCPWLWLKMEYFCTGKHYIIGVHAGTTMRVTEWRRLGSSQRKRLVLQRMRHNSYRCENAQSWTGRALSIMIGP